MISYNGWDREYLENKDEYYRLFDQAMVKEYEGSVESLENVFQEYTGRKHCVAVANATDALYFSLKSLGIKQGDLVMVSDFSWISTASMISMLGAIPIFCDIDLDTYHISYSDIIKKYGDNVKALIYTPLFGNMTDTSKIEQFCKNNNIKFIEDAAQAVGVSLEGRKAGTVGDCSSYSFNGNKVIAGISGGGMFMTDDDHQAEMVRKLRRHGKGKDFEMLGKNSKMLVPNAEIIEFRFKKWRQWQDRRQDLARIYDEVFEDVGLIIQKPENGLDHNYHKYTVRFEDKDTRKRVKNALKETLGFNASVHYEKPISQNSMYERLGHYSVQNVNSKTVSDTILSLPIHAWLTKQEVSSIANTVAFAV
jgi:dTDP-4-amino-4,6-dideoxygalactose transaminase